MVFEQLSKPTKTQRMQAAINSVLHQHGICPHNHDVDWSFGNVIVDGERDNSFRDLVLKRAEDSAHMDVALVRNQYVYVETMEDATNE